MCGRFALTTNLELLQERFSFQGEGLTYAPDPLDVRPTDPLITVVHRDGARRGTMMRWGFLPRRTGRPLINARVETLHTSNLWRQAFPARRCLILADAFYEWRAGAGKAKTQMWIGLKTEEPLAMAGIWGRFPDKPGNWVDAAAIITTGPNPIIEPIHDRMPVILTRETEALWLDPLSQDPDVLSRVLRPFESEAMTARDYVPPAPAGGTLPLL